MNLDKFQNYSLVSCENPLNQWRFLAGRKTLNSEDGFSIALNVCFLWVRCLLYQWKNTYDLWGLQMTAFFSKGAIPSHSKIPIPSANVKTPQFAKWEKSRSLKGGKSSTESVGHGFQSYVSSHSRVTIIRCMVGA